MKTRKDIFSADILCAEAQKVLRKRSSSKCMSFEEEIMSKAKYTSIFSAKKNPFWALTAEFLALWRVTVKLHWDPLNRILKKRVIRKNASFFGLRLLQIQPGTDATAIRKASTEKMTPCSFWRRANACHVSFKTLYGGQFTLSTQLIILNCHVVSKGLPLV